LSDQGGHDAAQAIMTTDVQVKEIALSASIGGKTVKFGAIAKGSGMIHPNMATMLSFITTDAAITPAMLSRRSNPLWTIPII
jgi:glutamate N-acetyltransferase/amino-acid N-acetyltransferase